MKLVKYFSDKRIGIRSAIIAGIFVIVAAFITGSFTIISSYITNSKNSEILRALNEYSKITNRFDSF